MGMKARAWAVTSTLLAFALSCARSEISPAGTGGAGGSAGAGGTTASAGATGDPGAAGAAGTTGAAGTAATAGTTGEAGRGGTTGAAGSTAGRIAGGAGGGGSVGTGGTGTPGSCPAGGWTPGDRRVTLLHGGIERAYEIHVPAGYTGATPVPLVMTIHGAHNTPALVRGWSRMNPVADQNGFIVAYPAALDCWNSGPSLPGCTMADDDVGFLTLVVADIKSHACIDPKRVYATGISNGAMMAQRLGCQRADVFAAVGGVAGPTAVSCMPARALSVVYVHGTEDRTVGYSSAQPNVNGWAMRNGCTGSPVQTYSMGSTTCVTHQSCRDGAEVVFCTVTGMGHCWPEDTNCGPGGGPSFGVADFKASPFMWEVFARHPLP